MLYTVQNIKPRTIKHIGGPNTVLKYRSTECFKYMTVDVSDHFISVRKICL